MTEKGKRDRRTLSIGFMLPYSTAQVVKLEIIKPSGEVVPVDIAANSKETIDTSQMESNIYDPNSKVLQVNISGLEINDVLHWVTRTTTLRSIIPGEFADENVLRATAISGISFTRSTLHSTNRSRKSSSRMKFPARSNTRQRPATTRRWSIGGK